MASLSRTLALDGPLDLPSTLAPLRRAGFGDPSLIVTAAEAWRATRTPDGPATERIRHLGDAVHIDAWGPGAGWLLDHAADLLGLHDQPARFRPYNPLLRELARRHRGLRLGRSNAVLEALVPTILEQKVPGREARTSYRRILHALGEPAPGPHPRLKVPPPPEALTRTPYETFHRFGVERRRAETVRRAASYASRLEEAAQLPLEHATARLRALPGVGEWSAAEVAATALGDPDAISVGDYHLPHMVAYALAGEARATDARMLELLEPYRGQRARVIRLLLAAGIGAPRFGPRLALNTQLGF